MLWRYTNEPGYKKQIRTEIANDLNIPIDDVKSKLTAFAHGSIKDIKKHKHYKIFQEESNKLSKAVMEHVERNEPKVLRRAEEQSAKRKDLPEELDWLDTESKETPKEMRAKASIFFYVWTWYERQIRQVMLDALNYGEVRIDEAGIEVHDAVYSKRDIDEKILEQDIRSNTPFNIIIEKEKK